jgi:GAF domain-containing protein
MPPTLDSQPILAGLRGLFSRNAARTDLLQYAADRIRAAGPPYTSVYLYMLHAEELVLEAWSGRDTEHTRIPVGKGVCGTAIATGEDQNVGDVRAIGNYIACNTFTRSELVVLIRRGKSILGQIDVDSDVPDPFGAEEEAAVRAVAEGLAALL